MNKAAIITAVVAVIAIVVIIVMYNKKLKEVASENPTTVDEDGNPIRTEDTEVLDGDVDISLGTGVE